MKLFRITCLFILFSLSAFAKDSTAVEFKRFALKIHGSPDYCYRKLSNTVINNQTVSILENRNQTELPAVGYTIGEDLSFFIKKQFAISLGVNFSQKTYQTESLTMVNSSGVILGKVKFKSNFNYIEIPVKAIFILGKKKIRFIGSAGVSSAFLLYQQTIAKYEYNDGSKYNKKELPNYIYKPFNLFLNGSIGIDCKLGKKMGLRVEPTFSYGLFDIKNTYYSEKLWSAGLNVGCYIKL